MKWFPLLPLCGALIAAALGVSRCEPSSASAVQPSGMADCPGAPERRQAASPPAPDLLRAAR